MSLKKLQNLTIFTSLLLLFVSVLGGLSSQIPLSFTPAKQAAIYQAEVESTTYQWTGPFDMSQYWSLEPAGDGTLPWSGDGIDAAWEAHARDVIWVVNGKWVWGYNSDGSWSGPFDISQYWGLEPAGDGTLPWSGDGIDAAWEVRAQDIVWVLNDKWAWAYHSDNTWDDPIDISIYEPWKSAPENSEGDKPWSGTGMSAVWPSIDSSGQWQGVIWITKGVWAWAFDPEGEPNPTLSPSPTPTITQIPTLTPTPTTAVHHNECQNYQCVEVNEPGNDNCSNDADCTACNASCDPANDQCSLDYQCLPINICGSDIESGITACHDENLCRNPNCEENVDCLCVIISTPTPTPTNSPSCGDDICQDSETYTTARWQDGTYCYIDCCQNYNVEKGDLDKNCEINSADWGVMQSNWTPASQLPYEPLQVQKSFWQKLLDFFRIK